MSTQNYINSTELESFRVFAEDIGYSTRPHSSAVHKGIQIKKGTEWMAVVWNSGFKRYTVDKRLHDLLENYQNRFKSAPEVLAPDDLLDLDDVQEYSYDHDNSVRVTPARTTVSPAKSTCVKPSTLAIVLEGIRQSSRSMNVLVPSTDFYRRDTDFAQDSISYVDPDALIGILEEALKQEIQDAITD